MITITDTLRIDDSDEINWVVQVKVTVKPKDKDARDEWRNRGYFPSLRAALIGAWNEHINRLGKERESITGLMSAMSHAEMAFLAAITEYGNEQKKREAAA